MTNINFWKAWSEPEILSGLIKLGGMAIADKLLPIGAPNSIKRRFSIPVPETCGEARLCTSCRRIFLDFEVMLLDDDLSIGESYKGSHRIHNDASLLVLSARSGCHLCIVLLDWLQKVNSSRSVYSLEPLSTTAVIRSQSYEIRPPAYLTQMPNYEGSVASRFEVTFTIGHSINDDPLWVRKKIDYQLTLHVAPVKELRGFITDKPIPSRTDSNDSLSLIQSWLQNCNKNHPKCSRSKSRFKPTRLINVGQVDTKAAPFLCNSKDLGDYIEYVTLSHCWGLKPIFRLLTSNLYELQQELPVEKLPQSFQDTIDVVRNLHFQYLWIDSLCIIQDSPQDWINEAAIMGQVYEHAVFNVAATGFQDGQNGIFVQRPPQLLSLLEIEVPEKKHSSKGVPQGHYYCLGNLWEEGIIKAPLNCRAWVCQERILSRRIVHFGHRQLFWECEETEACEIFPRGLPPLLSTTYKERYAGLREPRSLSLMEEYHIHKMWREVVTAYTGSQLTKQSDKLIAISGVAESIQKLLGPKYEYIAGLWKPGLTHSLLWSFKTLQQGGTKQLEYEAPSWSWASLDGQVVFQAYIHEGMFSVIDSQVTLRDNYPFGRVSHALLRVQGYLTLATFAEPDSALRQYSRPKTLYYQIILKSTETSRSPTLGLDLHVDVYPQPSPGALKFTFNFERDAIGSRDFFLFPIGHRDKTFVAGLILKQTNIRGRYVRLGMFRSMDRDESVDVFAAFQSLKPLLDEQDYEKHYSTNGTSIITLE